MSRFFLSRVVRPSLALGAALLVACASQGLAQTEPPAVSPRDKESAERQFYTQVRPLLATYCWSCHGATKQEGGLRLDRRDGWQQGGYSKRNLLETHFENNELLRRLQTLDPDERMPLGRAPLSEEDRRVIELWLKNGAPWTDEPAKPAEELRFLGAPSQTWQEKFWAWLELVLEYDLSYLHPVMYAGIGAFFIILLLEWMYERSKKRGVAPSEMRGIAGVAAHVRPYAYLAVLLGLLLAGLAVHHFRAAAELASVKESFERFRKQTPPAASVAPPASPNAADLAASRPLYLRTKAPFKFGGTYYRGNDERNDQLFNGGYYRTATMQLALCDRERKEIELGAELPPEGLQIRLIIIRGRGASPSLFSRQLMARTILTLTPPLASGIGIFPGENFLEEVRTGEEWHGYLPLPSEGPQARTADAYVVTGNFDGNQKFTGSSHFLVHYDLRVQNGRLAPDSELWLASTLFPGNMVWANRTQIAANEWFDFLPIPEIEGPNSSDPKLLGIPEHEKRLGLQLSKEKEANAKTEKPTSVEAAPPAAPPAKEDAPASP